MKNSDMGLHEIDLNPNLRQLYEPPSKPCQPQFVYYDHLDGTEKSKIPNYHYHARQNTQQNGQNIRKNAQNNASPQQIYLKEQVEEKKDIVGKKYLLKNLLGKGSFGEVYAARDLFTGEKLAIKIEPKNEKSIPMVKIEYDRFMQFKKYNPIGIPRAHAYFEENKSRMLVMSRLGESLENIFEGQGKKFSLNTLCGIAVQTISRLEFIHSCGVIHRDVKPDNFLIGPKGEENVIYLIDFGLSKPYVDQYKKHIPHRMDRSFKGTPRYCSIGNHSHMEQSRKDDLESLGYMLVYFAYGGRLPWMGIKTKKKVDKYEMIMAKKTEYTPDKLCKNLPSCFYYFLHYVKNLDFDEEPKYNYLKNLFKPSSNQLDWVSK